MNEVFERFGETDGKPVPLGDALKTFLRASGLSRRMRWRDLEEIWAAVVGEEVASHTRVVRWARGVVDVEVDSAPLMQELASFYKTSIINDMRARSSGRHIRDILFKLGEFT